eukprot:TRINITY_DN1034_c0_g1_i1.p1 TRINITY_DN1034_c0_g1~~TRINITY_DN1034_c0_g1_i1.p1  ORF type:complete len:287 (+),score=25.31 TRINITY_DN1034_c0_g1_i1:64-924(+)
MDEAVVSLIYLEEADEDLCCSICSEPFIDPVVLPGCGHTFCDSCLHSWLDHGRNHTCPSDRAEIKGKPTRNIMANNLVNKLKVKCSFCEWNGKREQLQTHQAKECESIMIPCANAEMGCSIKLNRREMKSHSEECPYDKVKSFLEEYRKIQSENQALKEKVQSLEKLTGRAHVHHLTRYATNSKGVFFSNFPYPSGAYFCDVCKTKKMGVPTYHCDICKNYDVCPNCWHPHHLKRLHWERDLRNNPEYGRGVTCDECKTRTRDYVYHCDTCKDFDLCQSCGGEICS